MDAYKYIHGELRRKASSIIISRLAVGLMSLATLALALAGLGFGLSFILPLTGPPFFAFSLLAWGTLIMAAARLVLSSPRGFGAEDAARSIEARYPDLDGNLVSALQLGGRRARLVRDLGFSGGMIDAQVETMGRRWSEVSKRPVSDRGRFSRAAAVLALALAAHLGASRLLGPDYGAVWAVMANPFSARPFGRPTLTVTPGGASLLEGDGFTVTARLSGDTGGLTLETRTPKGGAAESRAMIRLSPSSFSLDLPRVVESFSYRVAHPGVSSPWYDVVVTPVPRAGELALTLTPPAYTGLPPASQEGTGNLSCLKGTTVAWKARANKPLSEASLVMAGGRTVPLRIAGGLGLEGEFVVTGGGRYQVVLRDVRGLAGRQPDEYDVALVPDEYPAAELVAPREDLEVDQAEVVDVIFSARDDFGLGEVSLVYQLEDGRAGRLRLPHGEGRRRIQSGYGWDLGAIGLLPGQRVVYHLEVADNDAVSGPKTGVSAARSIRVKDTRAVHRDLAKLEEDLVKELTDILGDSLEQSEFMEEMKDIPPNQDERFGAQLKELAESQGRTLEKFKKSVEKMDEYLSRAAEDSLASPSSLYQKVVARQMLGKTMEGEKGENRELDELARMEDMPREDRAAELSWMAGEKEKRIGDMEKALGLLKEASKYQNMQEAVRRQEDLLDSQRDLLDRLEKMKGGLDEKSARQMSEMLQTMAGMLQDLMQQLTSLKDQLPEEFVNADALKDVAFQDFFKDLQEIAEALSRGDVETARRKAEELLKKMEDLLARLKEASRRQQSVTQQGIDDFQQKRMDELSKLTEGQKDLLRRAESLSETLNRRMSEARAGEAARSREELSRSVTAMEESLRRLQALNAAATNEDVARALPEINRQLTMYKAAVAGQKEESAREALQSLRREAGRAAEAAKARVGEPKPAGAGAPEGLAGLMESIEAASAAVNRSAPTQAQVATSGERESMAAMASEQAAIRERTSKLADRIEVLAKLFPLIGAELPQTLREATGFMGEAGDKLGAGSPGQAVPPAREALYRLMRGQDQAAQAAAQMSRMAGLQRGGQSSSSEARQLFGLMPGMGANPRRGEEEGGSSGLSIRNFRIPGVQEHEVPKVFREEIMESIRSGYPPAFEKAIKDYFRSIAE